MAAAIDERAALKAAAFCKCKEAMDALVRVSEAKCGGGLPVQFNHVTEGVPRPVTGKGVSGALSAAISNLGNTINSSAAGAPEPYLFPEGRSNASAANSVSASPAVTLTTPAANAVSAANATANANAVAQANIREQTDRLKLFKKQIQEAKNQRRLEIINGLLEKKKNGLTELQISQLKALIEYKKKSFEQRKIFSNGPTLARKVQPQPYRPLITIPNSNLNAESNSNTEPTASGVGQASRRQIDISPLQTRRKLNSGKVAQQAANALKKVGGRRKTQKRR